MDLTGLEGKFYNQVVVGLASLDKQGIRYVVTDTVRTQIDQFLDWIKGRINASSVQNYWVTAGKSIPSISDCLTIVTNCDGVIIKSKHQQGLAIDIVPRGNFGEPIWPDHNDPRWLPIIRAMTDAGCESGSTWTDFPDWPHYEYKGE